MRNPYELKSYADFLRVYPYLEELKKQSPVTFFPERVENQGLQGYTTGTRYEPWETRQPRGTYIKPGLSPEEESEVRRHESTHVATDVSPNWSYIMATQKPSQSLKEYLGLTYPKQMLVEESMIRALESHPRDEIGMTLKNRNKEMLSEDQRRLLESYRRMSQYGKQWGSFVGPEYDERELREGKGQDIVPKPPNVEIRNAYPMKRDLRSLKERIAQEKQAGYDLEGYIKKYGVPDTSAGQHLTDEFKLPNHITFSKDSIYSNDKTPGGEWLQISDGKWTYTPSDYVLSIHPGKELKEYFEKYEPESTLILPKSEEIEETERDIYSPRWRDLVR